MYHKIIIAGNLGRDPEMRYTPDGTPVPGALQHAILDKVRQRSGKRLRDQPKCGRELMVGDRQPDRGATVRGRGRHDRE